MWNLKLNRLVQIGAVASLSILSPALFAATYQCVQDGVVVYSDTRCGPNALQSGEVQNVYPGGLRAGELQLLNETISNAPAPAAGDPSGSYGERVREQNERRKMEGDKRRIPSKASSPWR
jgi:hypothetical protein